MKSLTTNKETPHKKPIMYEIDSHTNTEENIIQMAVSGDAKSAKTKVIKLKETLELPLEQRLNEIRQKEEELGDGAVRTSKGNEKELTYVPKDVREKEKRKKKKAMPMRKKRR